jgi:hypothetical protein
MDKPVKKTADCFTHGAGRVKQTPISSVEIVPARRRGVTGYANVGRGSLLGNPYRVGGLVEYFCDDELINSLYVKDATHAVTLYRERFFWYRSPEQKYAIALLDRDWPDGIVRLGCPCNGAEKGQPCHATVIKAYLEAEIARRVSR